jgi:hypothetical protein
MMATKPNNYTSNKPMTNKLGGFDAFLNDVRQRAAATPSDWEGTQCFIQEISDCYAFVRPQDILTHPLRFLKQAAGEPPVQFGRQGFNRSLIDDDNPARHYTAFVFIGFWLPTGLAILALWAWEILGFLRYRFKWSQPDIRSGYVGIRHGRAVRRDGAHVLPDLIARDLAE